MSKFPNQLALVGVVSVSAIALSVGLSERAAHKAEEAAHEAAMHAPATHEATVAPQAVSDAMTETVAEAPVAEVVAEQATETADLATKQVAETSEATATGEVAAAAAVVATAATVVDGATDMLDGQGDTTSVAGEDTAAAHGKFGLGRPALPEEIAAWDLDISPDGTGLPEGSGSVEDGEYIFADNCAVCHGDFAEGVDNWPKLAGGADTLDHDDPLKTVGSYWPYLSTTFDYVRRSMPFGAAQTMSDDDVYAMVAYILYSNDMVDDDFVLSKENFLEVEMPNAEGFFVDNRAETEYGIFSQEPCMENCKDSVEITMRAAVLDVTPQEEGEEEAAAPAAEAPTEVAAVEAPAPEAPATEAPAAEAVVADAAPVAEAPAAVAADPALVAAGEKVFKKCKACHQVGEGAKNKTGPILNGVVGRAVGVGDDFKYSKVMIEAGAGGMVWDEATLAGYLASPKKFLKGNKMSFAGLKKDTDVAAVIAFLQAHE